MSFANHNEQFALRIVTHENNFINKMTYTRSIDGFDWKGSCGINCPAIEISVADIQRGVRGILRGGRRVSNYRRLSRHVHHLTFLLDVTLGFIDRLLPYTVLLLSVVLILSQLFRALPRILSILQMTRDGAMTLRKSPRSICRSVELSDYYDLYINILRKHQFDPIICNDSHSFLFFFIGTII